MSYRSGYSGGGPPKNSASNAGQNSKGYSMNAVPPPSSLGNSRFGKFQKAGNLSSSSSSGQTTTGPPAATVFSGGLSKHGYSTMNSIAQFASSSQYALGKRKSKTEDEYFDDDEEATPDLAYIPAPGSPSANQSNKSESDSDDEDPLDAYMMGIEKHLEKEKTKPPSETQVSIVVKANKGTRGDIDDEDDEESYYRYMEENPMAGVVDDSSDVEVEYDEDGNPIAPPRKREIDPLPPIDHDDISYKPFEKNFYTPHDDINSLTRSQVDELRQHLKIRVSGPVPPRPVASFAHFGFDDSLIKVIRKLEYTQPTPIQSQAVPTALGGRDIIGIAKTGSGKTAAFVWPMLVHIMDQPELQTGDGPIALILAPTRELSLQIYNEAKKFGKVYNMNVVCCYGGGSKWEQSKALEQGAEIIVATPGRMIDMVKMKATNLQRVTYLVLDEADKMLNMGFEPQVRSICNHVRPDRQTLLFSATFKKRIEKLAREILTDPVKIVQGDVGEANEDVTQIMTVFKNPAQKWNWLLSKLVDFLSQGSVLIFVTKKADAEQVASSLQVQENDVLLLHGDIDQSERNKVITKFKKREVDILVATDVAARGLDIPHIRTVVNYDVARDIDTHTHRIGRTGRAGEKGTAYTLVTEKDKEFAGHLVRNLEGANQEVPDDLLELAMQSSWFRSSRFKSGKAKSLNYAGLGYKDRSGVGASKSGQPSGNTITSTSYLSQSSSSSNHRSSSGPATNRFAAMREAFRSQYTSQFRASSDRTWEETVPEKGVFAAPPMPSQNKPSSDSDNSKKSGKRSRWN
ncbi:ATP-dependent RNA helicase DDX42 [Sitodiplosis mosellana]|uniref:ATP-dependent RNA helicase DDX42 n=1 Tax=Sitodiplosis mosellana TaxID=263140 RepID=UPI002443FD04|nr:ATP-dependent RNA helicase DDX42 [Sitodiplosis mosellana]